MIDPKNIADLVKVNGKWELSFFIPSQPAFMWDSQEGKRGILYAIQCNEFCKLGMTTEFDRRLKNLEAGTPYDIAVVGKKTVQFAGLAYSEAWMHKKHADRRVKNEWFRLSPEEAHETLQEAIAVASVYARKCREWFYEDRRQKANDPEFQARMKKEYEQFVDRYATNKQRRALLKVA